MEVSIRTDMQNKNIINLGSAIRRVQDQYCNESSRSLLETQASTIPHSPPLVTLHTSHVCGLLARLCPIMLLESPQLQGGFKRQY